MRILQVALVACGSSSIAAGQELITNGSFEQASGCPAGHSELILAEPWIPPTLGTPDYYNPCNTLPNSAGVPDNGVGSQAAFDLDSYAGFFAAYPFAISPDYREYLQQPLSGAGLEAGKTYRFSMSLSLAEKSSVATDRIGAYFSPTAVGSGDSMVLPFLPQVETPAGTFLDDTSSWMSFTDTFVAAGGEQHVTIGNFRDEASTATTPAGFGPDNPVPADAAYYYLDLVSVTCEPCLEPPADLAAWWPLDDTSGILALEIVGGQHGALLDAPLSVPGFVDTSLSFLGSAVSVPTSPALEPGTGDFSLDLWVRPDALGTTQTLVAKIAPLGPPSGPGFALALQDDGTVRFLMVDAALGSASGDSTATLEAGSWSHVTVAVDRDDPAGGRIHVDGVLSTFDPTTAPGDLSSALPLLFARDDGAGVGADLAGALDEIEFFHRALEPGEAVALYQARTSGKCKVILVLEPVTAVPVSPGPGVMPTIGTSGWLGNGGGLTGTFTVAVHGEPAGTLFGIRRSTVDGPLNPVVVDPQPIQVSPGTSVPVRFELDVPPGLTPGEFACYAVTTTHLESGRVFVSRGGLHARPRGVRTLPSGSQVLEVPAGR